MKQKKRILFSDELESSRMHLVELIADDNLTNVQIAKLELLKLKFDLLMNYYYSQLNK